MYNIKKWSENQILNVWKKGNSVPNNDPAIFRKDNCRDWMKFSDHGDRNSKYGWEIDHIIPESKGGGDELSNLQPLHWENNLAKGDSSKLICYN